MIKIIGVYLLLRGIAGLFKPCTKDWYVSEDFLVFVYILHGLISLVFGLFIMWKL